ncbi:MAG: chorismate synthase [Candidatus Thorarchaeota archaeon]|nr:chorismate synthase [Candidatus Thorarchaeota archaeon]
MTFTFGKDFKLHVYGESHGESIGVVVEGVPPGILIDTSMIQQELDKRRPGSGHLVSSRSEKDQVTIRSGVFKGKSTGAPITMTIPNTDVDSSSYEEIRHIPRPGHADYTARVKYSEYNDYRGGGVFSGRMTAAFVMAGAIAKQVLDEHGIKVLAHVVQVGKVRMEKEVSSEDIRRNVYQNPIRCADIDSVSEMKAEVEQAKAEGDSVGGIVECRILGVPAGFGEPLFDSVESVISHAIFSIPGVKGIEFGSGFGGSLKRGSENNDSPVIDDGGIQWSKNDSGGVLGGITNGAPIVFRVAFKPTPSISKVQSTVDLEKMEETSIQITGRHDPSIVPRAVPVVEGLAAAVMVDLMKRNASQIHH